MKYEALPIIVDAWEILEVQQTMNRMYVLTLKDNPNKETATPEMTARMLPTPGDFWVVTGDGYKYLNPRNVFLSKYRPQRQKK